MFQKFTNRCSICNKKIVDSNLPAYFPHYVCQECDKLAVTQEGQLVLQLYNQHVSNLRTESPFGYKDILFDSNTGPNPVFIKGHKCWRRYRMGSWVTMKDVYNSRTLEEFEQNNFE